MSNEMIILADIFKLDIEVTAIMFKLREHNSDEYSFLDFDGTKEYDVHYGLKIFENEDQSVNKLFKLATVYDFNEELMDGIRSVIDDLVFEISKVMDIIMKTFVGTPIFNLIEEDDGQAYLENERIFLDVVNKTISKRKKYLNRIVDNFITDVQYNCNRRSTLNASKKFLRYKKTHKSATPNKILCSQYGSTFIITDIESDDYQKININ